MAYLLQSRHGIFYFRLNIPERHRHIIGKTEIRKSLGTRSKREADRRCAQVLVEVLAMLDRAVGDGGPLMSVVLKDYLEVQKREGLRLKTIWDKEHIVKILIKIVGDKPIEAFTLADAKKFRDTALQLPPRVSRYFEEGSTVAQVLKMNKGTISISSYNNWAKNLVAFFSYAEKEGLVERNYLKGMKVSQKVRVSSFKDVITMKDVGKIFDHTKEDKGVRDERYWLPRLGFYTGARLGELCQLRVEDVVTVEGIDCIYIREGEEQIIKNLNSERLIPLHSSIQEEFLVYVRGLTSDRLFPLLKYSIAHGSSNQASKWFSGLIKELAIEGKVTYHSYRHLVATILKNQGVDVSLVASLLGHSTGTITYDRYGKSLSPRTLVPVVEAIAL